MKYSLSSFASVAILLAVGSPALAQSSLYGQCGGTGWSGATSCVSGSVCTYSNAYYSQCLPGTATSVKSTTSSTSVKPTTTSTTSVKATTTTTSVKSTSTVATSTSTAPSSSTGTATKFKYFGVNESGAEFGNTAIPGILGTDYTWPAESSIDYFVGEGFNTFRVTFLMERISPPANGLTGAFDPTYLAALVSIITYITGKGAYALVDPHNFMSYNGAVISSTSDFGTWWKNLATEFKSNSNVIFDCMNEPNGIAAATVFSLMQAAVTGIRSSGATTQLILVEGTSWTGAWTWVSSGNSAVFAAISDPYNNTAIEMHQYLDSDGSGTSAVCVSQTIGAERIAAATAWLQANNLKGFLGEIGAGNGTDCIAAVYNTLSAMQAAGGTWIGAVWWAAGPWWGDYFMSIEPPSGAAIAGILPQALKPFL